MTSTPFASFFEPIAGIREALLFSLQEGIPFALYHQGRARAEVATSAAAHLATSVRNAQIALHHLHGQDRPPLAIEDQVTFEVADAIASLLPVGTHGVGLLLVFDRTTPLGLARLHGAELQRNLLPHLAALTEPAPPRASAAPDERPPIPEAKPPAPRQPSPSTKNSEVDAPKKASPATLNHFDEPPAPSDREAPPPKVNPSRRSTLDQTRPGPVIPPPPKAAGPGPADDIVASPEEIAQPTARYGVAGDSPAAVDRPVAAYQRKPAPDTTARFDDDEAPPEVNLASPASDSTADSATVPESNQDRDPRTSDKPSRPPIPLSGTTTSPPSSSGGPMPPPMLEPPTARPSPHLDTSQPPSRTRTDVPFAPTPSSADGSGSVTSSSAMTPPEIAPLHPYDRAEQILLHLTQHATDPHSAMLRVSLQTGLPMALLRTPERMSESEVEQVEASVKRILGVDSLPL